MWGRTPRVLGTLNPTSPLRRRRRYLATAWVRGAGKYADRLGAAPRLIRASLGRSGRVSFKQPQSNNHSGRQQGLGLWIGCNPGWRAVAGKQLQQWLFVGWRVEIPGENVGLGRRGCKRVHCSTDLPDSIAIGWYHRVGRRMFLRSRYGCSDYVSMLSTTCLYTYDHTSSHPNLPEPYGSPPPPLPATTPRLRASISGGPRVWPCFRPTLGG